MLIIKEEIEVIACEICGKAISPGERPFFVEDKLADGKINKYNFHKECVEMEIVKIAKKTIFSKTTK